MKKQRPAKPLPVPVDTGFYYELGKEKNTAQMKEYELWATGLPDFVTRVGRRLFFNFRTAADRDDFMNSLEKALKVKGLIVERTFL